MFVLCTQSVGSCLGGGVLISTAACSVQPPLPPEGRSPDATVQLHLLKYIHNLPKEDLLQIKRNCFFKINNVLLQPSRVTPFTTEFKNRDEAITAKCSSLIRRTSQESAAARTQVCLIRQQQPGLPD